MDTRPSRSRTMKWPTFAGFLMGTIFACFICSSKEQVSAAPTTTAAATGDEFYEAPDYGQKVQKITALLASAPTSQPSSKDEAELLDEARHDPDFRIRVRAMMVLPFIHDREKAIDVLIASVHDRDPSTSGRGNVPLYATNYLADMKAVRAIPDVESWIEYLQKTSPMSDELAPMVLKKMREDLARLKAATTQPSSAD